jgi:preprotein translocase subunit SecG
VLILVQHGKGADMGAAFGSGSARQPVRRQLAARTSCRASTAVLAAVFFACTLLLAYFGHARPAGGGSLLERAAIGRARWLRPRSGAGDSAAQIPAAALRRHRRRRPRLRLRPRPVQARSAK